MMGAEEEAAARQRWLEARSADAMRPPPPQSSYEEEERLRKEARERMRQMMGGDNDKLKAGVGAAFGFGPEDDEDYGYGPPRLLTHVMSGSTTRKSTCPPGSRRTPWAPKTISRGSTRGT